MEISDRGVIDYKGDFMNEEIKKAKALAKKKEWNRKHSMHIRTYQQRVQSEREFGGNREAVLERDNYTCQGCGMTNEEHLKRWERTITVDHVDGKGRNSEEKNNNLDNLITLCLSCHGKKDEKKRKMLSKEASKEYQFAVQFYIKTGVLSYPSNAMAWYKFDNFVKWLGLPTVNDKRVIIMVTN